MAPSPQNLQLVQLRVTLSPLPQVQPEIATLAMQRFQCTGGDCSDTCCRDFGVAFEKQSMRRMLTATADDPAARERVVRLVVLGRKEAMVVLNEQGACPPAAPRSRGLADQDLAGRLRPLSN